MEIHNFAEDYDEEEEEEEEPEDDCYEVKVAYVSTFKVLAKNKEEAVNEIYRHHWNWNMDFFEPEILDVDWNYKDSMSEEDLDLYVPIDEFYKSIYVIK